ncbi:MAG: hypothetical protein H7Y20_02455 [Bryobacteraceae bacterium]|nr:hypothetical protein [Bryobacteraceae bacterium]
MTPDQEKKVLETLYDRLYDALTHVPGGEKTGDFDKATTFLQMTKNVVLNPDDFRNAASSINPKGDLRSTFALSALVDVVPTVSAEWSDSTKLVSETYKNIVDNANADNTEDPAQKAIYDKAYAFLNSKSSIPNFDGPATETFGPSAIALAYDQNQTAYVNAIGGYRLAFNSYNLDNLEDQRKFQAVAPGLQNTIDQAWNKWVREGKQNVERASNALRTSINNAISAAITQAQDSMNDQSALAPQLTGGKRWFASYVMPTNWHDPSCRGSKLTLSSKFLATSTSDESSEYSSHSKGLFWTSTSSEDKTTKVNSTSMQSDDFELSAELITVRIRRPWLNSILFNMTDWWASGTPKDRISNGKIKGNESSLLPLIPTAFIVAKDVTIKANFTSQDTEHFTSDSSSRDSRGWGWGPFSGGGRYAHSRSENDKFQASYANGLLKLPGLQLIAWVSTITPPCPPKDEPASA